MCYLKIYRATDKPFLEILICKSGYFSPYPWHYSVHALSQLFSNKIPQFKVAILTFSTLFYQCTCTSLQDLGLYGPWCSYATGNIMNVCKLSQSSEDIPVHPNQPSVIFGVKVASETIFEHLICNIFLGKGVEHALLVS